MAKAQIAAAAGLLDGFVIWAMSRTKKARSCRLVTGVSSSNLGRADHGRAHAHGLPVIYHGCGNAGRFFADYIEIGIDAYNPLEVKAGMDAVDLRRQFDTASLCAEQRRAGLETGDQAAIKGEVLRKLNAARAAGSSFRAIIP